MAGAGARHRVPAPRGFGQRRASGAPGDQRRKAADISSANDFLRAAGSGPAACLVQGPVLQGQV